MLKVGLLCGVIAAMSATGVKASLDARVESKPCDARFIVELKEDIENLTADEAIKQQDSVIRKIKRQINSNVVKDRNFTILNNAFVIKANKSDKEAILDIPGVKEVTEDGQHVVKHTEGSNGFTISVNGSGDGGSTIDLSQNASSITMKKPDNTNDGEGTLIAVLDNEFYLRAEHKENGVTVPSYSHVTFTDLDKSVHTRIPNFTQMKKRAANTYAIKKQISTADLGEEGSLYFNRKVPFYYDYAGDSYTGSSSGAVEDFDVESKIDLHGSHVASIAAGNDPDYKGIAPKAQLALMKVFTDVHSTPASDAAGNGKYGSFSEIGFITALEDAIALKVDAINVSIGSDLADFEQGSISQRTLDKIAKAGILSAISAGNGGKSSYAFTGGYANWTQDMVETGVMGSFANNASTMTIASGQPEWTFYENSLRIGDQVVPYEDQIVNRDGEAEDYTEEHRMQQLITESIDPDLEPTPEQQLKEIGYVYVKGFGEKKDYDKKDLSNKVAIVNRGKTSFAEKYAAAEEAGASALLIINNDPTENDFTFRCDFGDEKGSINKPVALVLFKDKPFFEANPEGKFMVKKNTSSVNKLANTISDFSTEGATYDLDLKPEITTPGSNIKGAVWPQNKKEKLPENKFKSYEYFNGTSMAAPNYEGAMAVVLSKVTKDLVADNRVTDEEEQAILDYRKTINMRMMSTAIPMHDYEKNQEDNQNTLTSPRMQGAGMVNLDGAYNTEVYVKGSDTNRPDEELDTSKILLRNSEGIAKGNIKLNFTVVNESSSEKSFAIKYNVMRPALAKSNKVLTDDYAAPIEVSDVRNFTGWEYYAPEEHKVVVADGKANYKDVFKVAKDIEYYATEAAYLAETPDGVIKEGLYYCADENPQEGQKVNWQICPDYDYQSVKDVQIAEVNGPTITVPANGSLKVSLDEFAIPEDAKAKIEELYATGTFIEGFVSLKAQGSYPDLSVPYMGFYSLTDKHADYDYSTPEVVEPFEFEKDSHKIYGSDLINDVAKSLLGKDNVEYGSLMMAGYAKNIKNINTDKILTNDLSFKQLDGFYPVGTAPTENKSINNYTEMPSNDIYVGNPLKSNTLIIQQFVMRSVADNYYTITNKATGEEVYRNALTDMLFGTTMGKANLYKSHVDADYLGAGYVAHRAVSIAPLYNPETKVPFASGDYELKFNYQLAGTGKWVSKAYTLHIDAESPLVSSIVDFKEGGVDKVRITFKDTRCAYALVGSNKVEVKYDEKQKVYYADVNKAIVDSAINKNATEFSSSRLIIRAYDYARGETVAIVHFSGNDYSHYTLAQGQGFSTNADFTYENDVLKIYEFNEDGTKVEVTNVNGFNYVSGDVEKQNDTALILGLSIGGGVLVLGGIGVGIFFLLKKKKIIGGK